MTHYAIITVRDPDGETSVRLFVDGVEHDDFIHYEIDPGRGHTWEDWTEMRDADLELAEQAPGEELWSAVANAYDDPPGSKYIDKPDDEPWLPPTIIELNER